MTANGQLNLLEIKKGFQKLAEVRNSLTCTPSAETVSGRFIESSLYRLQEGTVIKLSAQRFAKLADTDGDKVVNKDEFFVGSSIEI